MCVRMDFELQLGVPDLTNNEYAEDRVNLRPPALYSRLIKQKLAQLLNTLGKNSSTQIGVKIASFTCLYYPVPFVEVS